MAPTSPTSVQLCTGEYFDHIAPDPSVITLDVLERGLDVPRFNNQTRRPITVLEHSLRVHRIARELGSTGPWPLLHDAHEALVPWGDCLRPGKTDEMREAEASVDAAIITALQVEEVISVWDIVATADAIALYFEAMLWMSGGADWATRVFPQTHEITGGGHRPQPSLSVLIERFMPLIAPRRGECWRTEVESLIGKR
jgi:hypothetical protein